VFDMIFYSLENDGFIIVTSCGSTCFVYGDENHDAHMTPGLVMLLMSSLR